MRFLLLFLCSLLILSPQLPAQDPQVRVHFKTDRNAELTNTGRILTRAEDGGLLFQSPDSRLWTITPQQLIAEQPVPEKFQFWTVEEQTNKLSDEFGPAFTINSREPYLFCSDADPKFLDSVARVMLRLDTAFTKFWSDRQFPLHAPEHPLVVLIFKQRADYERYATREFGPEIAQAPGYFSMIQNRIVFHDITAGLKFTPQTTMEDRLEKSGRQVSTIVHEATHQLAFNTGLQTRLADNPLWLTEGLAMYFETPDLKNRTGWTTAGKINPVRLQTYLKSIAQTPQLSLQEFVSSDAPFRNPKQEGAAYARAWALTYYLLTKHPDKFTTYLQTISSKKPLIWNTPAERLHDFESAFGPAPQLQPALEKFYTRKRQSPE
ncbi:MAG: DUF1570 domain-containing protein [Planctomycetales bacterium]